MKIEAGRSWLHPVKRPISDDLYTPHNDFDFSLSHQIFSGDYRLTGKLKFEDPHLSSLMRDGKAVGLLHLECPRTFFRTTLPFLPDGTLDHVLSHKSVIGTAEVLAVIVTSGSLDEYNHPHQNKDYMGSAFKIETASILAASETREIEFFPDLDLIRKVSSLISFKCGDESQKKMKVDAEKDLIIVSLPVEEYDLYRELRVIDEAIKVLTNAVLGPAILQSMHHLRSIPTQDLDSFKAEHRWARIILSRLPSEEFPAGWLQEDPSRCLDAVQFLLSGSLKESMMQTKELIENVR